MTKKIILVGGLVSAIALFANTINLAPDISALGGVEGPASAVDTSVPVYDSTTGKLIKDLNDFRIDGTKNLMCPSAATGRADFGGTQETSFDSYKAFRVGLGSTVPTGVVYTTNSANTKLTYLGQTNAAATGNPGIITWNDTLDVFNYNGVLDGGLSFLGGGAKDHWFARTKDSTTAALGFTHGLLQNGSIWMQNPNAVTSAEDSVLYISAVSNDDLYIGYGTRELKQADDATADAVQAPSYTISPSDKTAGTGGGGDLLFDPGSGFGGGLHGVTRSARGFAHTPGSVSVTADNQSVTVQNGVLVFSSDSVIATDRTIALADGTADGQIATFIFNDATDLIELVDDDTQFCGSASWLPTHRDSLSIVWNTALSCWVETSRSVN